MIDLLFALFAFCGYSFAALVDCVTGLGLWSLLTGGGTVSNETSVLL